MGNRRETGGKQAGKQAGNRRETGGKQAGNTKTFNITKCKAEMESLVNEVNSIISTIS